MAKSESQIMDIVMRCGLRISNILGPGFVWEVYRNAFLIELEEHHLKYSHQQTFPVKYKNKLVGEFLPHVVIENKVIVQIYCEPQMKPEQETQTNNYMRASDIEHGVILNFGDTFEFKKCEF